MLFTSIARSVLTLTVLGPVTAGLAIGETATVKQLEVEKKGIKLIGQVEDVARDISYHADLLNSFTPWISKETHFLHLEQIKSLVNQGLRPAFKRLTEIQPQLSAWHQDTIDQMLNSANALAAGTNSAILNRKEARAAPPPVLNAEYSELISTIYEHSKALVTTSDAAGDYAAANRQAVEAGLKESARR
jgi:hypothetical protein